MPRDGLALLVAAPERCPHAPCWSPLMLANLLAHPLTRGMDIDSPETTHLRKRIIGAKPFLRRIYQEWYAAIAVSVPPDRGGVLELGSGAGFLEDYIPGL